MRLAAIAHAPLRLLLPHPAISLKILVNADITGMVPADATDG